MTDESGYKLLASRTTIRHAPDVARLRQALNSFGYDASPPDIQQAWGEYSEAEFTVEWMPLEDWNDQDLFGILWDHMDYADGTNGHTSTGE